jgi:hypothetical protein
VLRSDKRTPQVVEAVPAPEQEEAQHFTKEDMQLAQMFAGASFGDGFKMTLPSGKTITGKQINDWQREK